MRRILTWTISALLISSGIASAEPYYGEFIGELRGTFIRGGDRPLFRLDEDFMYMDPNGLKWIAPKGEVIDGASIPRWAWTIIGGPFSGNYLRAAVIHDYYCCAKNRAYSDTHKAFSRGMRLEGVGNTKADIMWLAVLFGGPAYWDVDPNEVPPIPCKREELVVSGDWSVLHGQPEYVQGMAIGKVVAIARTLKTTNGSVIDVVKGNVIRTGTEEEISHIRKIREALDKKFDVPLEELGLFSSMSVAETLAFAESGEQIKVATWRAEQVPELDSYFSQIGFMDPYKDVYYQDTLIVPDRIEKVYDEDSWSELFSALGRP